MKKIYCQPSHNFKYFLFSIYFLSLPFIFIFVLNIFILNNQFSEKGVVFNEYNNFADEIIYNNIFENNTLDLEIENLNKISSSKDTHYTSKFEEVTQNYKNNLSKYSISLKKVNLLHNTSEKKKEFIKTILPLAVNQNKKILAQRQRLIEIKNYLNRNKTFRKEDQRFFENLTSEYSVLSKNRHKIDVINDLLISIDIIPNSIVLAQAANESGWGSSRFATEYNALFGESTYDSKAGIVPFEREEGKKHLVKYFKTINKSVESYFININSHFAYDKFRKFRKILRDNNTSLNINLLVDKLDTYAEDDKYVDTIVSIIYDNNLTQYDDILSLLIIS